MNALNHQVVQLFEEGKLTPEQIAADLEFDVIAVKAVLLQFSNVYRELQKKADKNEIEGNLVSNLIDDTEIKEMLDIIKDLARFSEVDGVKGKMACRVIDEKMGRLDPVKEVKSASYNLILFNQQLLNNRKTKKKVEELEEAIDV